MSNIIKEDIYLDKISELLRKAPTDDGTFLGSLYDLYVFIGITKGVDDVRKEKGMTLHESRERMKKKYESYNARFGSWIFGKFVRIFGKLFHKKCNRNYRGNL